MAIGKFAKYVNVSMLLGPDQILWVSSSKYLGVTVCGVKSISFDTGPFRSHFLQQAIFGSY